jgi:ribosomal protein S18
MPASYLLDDEDQCKNFFRHLETKEYATKVKKNNIVYIWKIGEGVHGGKGVLPFDRKLEVELKEKYDKGAKCGKLKEHVVMQQYVNNPLLLHGRKFDFRMYMLVASTNPLIAYYHDGYMRVSLANYDKNSEDLFAHLTNAHVSEQAMEEAKKHGTWRNKTYEELTAMQYGDFNTLGEFLVETGRIPSMDWIETDLRYK